MQAARGDRSPTDVDYVRHADRIELSWRWFRLSALFNVVWLTFWFGILSTFWFASAASGSLTPLLMTSLHTLAGLWVAYRTAVQFFNRTVVTLDLQQIRIVTGPIPVRGGRQEFPSADITQIYVQKAESKKNQPSNYEIHALTNSYDDFKLAGGIKKLGTAHFIEAELEDFLEIQDQPVAGASARQHRPPPHQPADRQRWDVDSDDDPFSPRPANLRDGDDPFGG